MACTCGHDGLAANFHMRPCPIKVAWLLNWAEQAARRFEPRTVQAAQGVLARAIDEHGPTSVEARRAADKLILAQDQAARDAAEEDGVDGRVVDAMRAKVDEALGSRRIALIDQQAKMVTEAVQAVLEDLFPRRWWRPRLRRKVARALRGLA